MVVISVCTYGVKIIKKFRWESGFLWGGGSMETPPLCTNGSAGYLMQLSPVNNKIYIFNVEFKREKKKKEKKKDIHDLWC